MTSGIPVVQGVAVPSGGTAYVPASSGYDEHSTYTGGEFNGVKGEVQPKRFNDAAFAFLFVAHLIVMFVILSMGTASFAQNGGGNGGDYSGVIWCTMTCGLVAVGLSTLALGFMFKFATELVKTALIFSVISSLMIGVLGLLSGDMLMTILGFVFFAIGCCYAYFVWARIPFAASNLRTALTAVQANMGLTVVALFFMFVAFGWSVWWIVGLSSALVSVGQGIIFLFLVSYYWTHQVITNTVHVTTVGVIGTWWFVPDEASSCCSRALTDSFVRATTYSFGSICFGSLVVAVVQALRALHRMAQDNEDMSILVCIIDCILACIQGIIEYFNKWAYVYVGLYGYSYLDAGRNVLTLFQHKGWTTIITDDLADNVLSMISVGIALVGGLVGFLLGKADQNLFAGIGVENPGTVGFMYVSHHYFLLGASFVSHASFCSIGLVTGFLISSILMSVVASAVNTVIVCFAESPAEFDQNHPHLSAEMRAAWRQAWPAECGNM